MEMSGRNSSEILQTSLLTVTQTAVGCGIGLLLAGKLQRPTQKTTAATLFSIGLLLAVPAVVGGVIKVWNRSERGARKRLDSIRRDPGFPDEADVV